MKHSKWRIQLAFSVVGQFATFISATEASYVLDPYFESVNPEKIREYTFLPENIAEEISQKLSSQPVSGGKRLVSPDVKNECLTCIRDFAHREIYSELTRCTSATAWFLRNFTSDVLYAACAQDKFHLTLLSTVCPFALDSDMIDRLCDIGKKMTSRNRNAVNAACLYEFTNEKRPVYWKVGYENIVGNVFPGCSSSSPDPSFCQELVDAFAEKRYELQRRIVYGLVEEGRMSVEDAANRLVNNLKVYRRLFGPGITVQYLNSILVANNDTAYQLLLKTPSYRVLVNAAKNTAVRDRSFNLIQSIAPLLRSIEERQCFVSPVKPNTLIHYIVARLVVELRWKLFEAAKENGCTEIFSINSSRQPSIDLNLQLIDEIYSRSKEREDLIMKIGNPSNQDVIAFLCLIPYNLFTEKRIKSICS